MQSKALVCEEFEKKMWLFMDSSLNKEEMLYWESHLRECRLCSGLLLETKEALSVYESLPFEDLEEETFTKMVNKAVKKKRAGFILGRFLEAVYEFLFGNYFRKFAFGGAAFMALAALLLFISRPGEREFPPVMKKSPPSENRSTPSMSTNIAEMKATVKATKKTAPVKATRYEWQDKATAYNIKRVGTSLENIRIKEDKLRAIDEWTLQAIALRRKMQLLQTDLEKSEM
ncbi:MAG: zf-HC2 domain-containing protein [Ignavibacteria bacterium]|jgi:hypothetical protein|nr:zf-HC2 domain-containing protein [Ignavibacteria bacterium]MCU7503357.1 zf-HC2 domain-containing protein [Ignavibacteria bacterium]MCU7515697.1 zf-HC2 domain-containing protein [Ignavibacteria bacterium]